MAPFPFWFSTRCERNCSYETSRIVDRKVDDKDTENYLYQVILIWRGMWQLVFSWCEECINGRVWSGVRRAKWPMVRVKTRTRRVLGRQLKSLAWEGIVWASAAARFVMMFQDCWHQQFWRELRNLYQFSLLKAINEGVTVAFYSIEWHCMTLIWRIE